MRGVEGRLSGRQHRTLQQGLGVEPPPDARVMQILPKRQR
jgi:hypothetical protein